MKERTILFGIPPASHVSLAMDEVSAMEQLGYQCFTTPYGRNDQSEGKLTKLAATVRNALQIVSAIRKRRPAFLFLNSRFEPVGSMRDFITLLVLRLFIREMPGVIIKSHGSNMDVLRSDSFLFKRMVIPFLSRHVDFWLFLSSEEKEILMQLNHRIASHASVIPNIIVPSRCDVTDSFRKKYPLPTNKFNCLYAGRLTEVKGVFDIMESISHLHHPDRFHFIFVGSGPDMERLKKESEKFTSSTTIQFTGFIPDAECDQFYGAANVLLYPTYDSEGFPMALFKSVACGLPVVTTPIRAAKDYLSEPENAMFVNPKSPGEIAAALEKIFTNADLRDSMSKNNCETGGRFSKEKVGRLIDTILMGGKIEKAKQTQQQPLHYGA